MEDIARVSSCEASRVALLIINADIKLPSTDTTGSSTAMALADAMSLISIRAGEGMLQLYPTAKVFLHHSRSISTFDQP